MTVSDCAGCFRIKVRTDTTEFTSICSVLIADYFIDNL